jgi:hypothetical protein
MRELILIGAPGWIEERLATLQPGVDALARAFGLAAEWQPANDPFFLPRAQGKAHLQRLLGTKIELCLRDGLAIASINRHRTFFGERFEIFTGDGAPAHSACVAFGLDRWAAHANRRGGFAEIAPIAPRASRKASASNIQHPTPNIQ